MDIQYVFEGIERIGYANINCMRMSGEYAMENDFALFEGEGDFLVLPSGTFAIFAPQDVHMPAIAEDKPTMVKKVVIKERL